MDIAAIVLALCAGFYMAWNIGANDAANALGCSVGSRALTYKQAVLVGSVLEFAGAVLVGAHVTETVRKKIIAPADFVDRPEILMLGMMAALFGAGLWLQVASRFGRPVSTTHSIVGAVCGFGLLAVGPASVNWSILSRIVMSWFVSPLLAGTLAFLLFRSIQHLVLNAPDPGAAAVKWSPLYAGLVLFVVTMVTIFKGLKHLRLDLPFRAAGAIAVGMGLAAAGVCRVVARRLYARMDGLAPPPETTPPKVWTASTEELARPELHVAEKVFGALQVCSACAMAFAHGSNDVGNATGPFAAVVSIALAPDKREAVAGSTAVPLWVLCIGGLGISVGLATYGWRVMQTIGKKITDLVPSRGFSADFAAASTVVIGSRLGLPLSTTHTVVGAVMGVGFARGIASLDPRVLRDIGIAWLVEIPAAALFTMVLYYLLRLVWGV